MNPPRAILAAGVLLLASLAMGAAGAGPERNGAHLVWENGILRAGAGGMERTWDLAAGLPRARSLRAGGREWILQDPDARAALFRQHRRLRREAGGDPATLTLPAGCTLTGPLTTTWAASFGRANVVEAESWHGTLTVLGNDGAGYRWHLKVFPGVAAVLCRLELVGTTAAGAAAANDEATPGPAQGVETEPAGATFPGDDLLEDLVLDPPHAMLTVVELGEQTDRRDRLAQERTWPLHPSETITARTGLLALDDPLTDAGLAVLKLDALPDSRPVPTPQDVRAGHRVVRVYGHGAGGPGQGCWWAVTGYHGGRWARAAALHAVQARLRTNLQPELLSNTWGDRSRDARISEAFIATEIARGAALGVDVCQIDDGWQKGITANSAQGGGIWGGGFWAADGEFWSPRPAAFPRGFEPLAAQARERGVALGLWFHPDGADGYANWERDAEALLALHRRHGIRHFKIDGVNLGTKAGQVNVERFVDRILEETRGGAVFDFDVTAGRRPGYFGLVRAGPVFVENRYTDWHNWWPHATLRNLWELSWYVPPQRLRIEFLNPARNTELYRGDPLAPSACPPDYPCAVALAAAPLAWFEVSGLPEDVFRPLQALIGTWRKFRDEWHRGTVLPVGERPSGTAWTGFCSVGDGVRHVLVFRERTRESATALALPATEGNWRVERIAGEGHAVWQDGRLHVAEMSPLRYAWFRLTPAD